MIKAKDLTKEPPRSPRERVGPYILLPRMADKGRAELNGTQGEYHFNCPLDQMLFSFKKVDAEEVREQLKMGLQDEQLAEWFDEHGEDKRAQDYKAWRDDLTAYRPYEDEEKRDWFVGECKPHGLDPRTTTLFEYLEADDKASFGQSA